MAISGSKLQFLLTKGEPEAAFLGKVTNECGETFAVLRGLLWS